PLSGTAFTGAPVPDGTEAARDCATTTTGRATAGMTGPPDPIADTTPTPMPSKTHSSPSSHPSTHPHSPPDPLMLRRAFGCFPTGVTVITARTDEGASVGLTVNSWTSL